MNAPHSASTRPLDVPGSDPAEDSRAALRRGVYGLLIALSIGVMIGRIFAVNSVDRIGQENDLVARAARKVADATKAGRTPDAAEVEQWQKEARAKLALQRPFLSANDRSRWDTIRSLVEHGTYAIDDVVAEPNWDTIDMVQHVGRDGKLHLYSSKPPLLATLLAGEYWLIYRVTGASLGEHPYEIGRFMLITINVIPLWIFFLLLVRLLERWGRSDWGRLYVMSAATLGTFLTTFAIVLNNHITAAVTTMVAIYAVIQIWYGPADGRTGATGKRSLSVSESECATGKRSLPVSESECATGKRSLPVSESECATGKRSLPVSVSECATGKRSLPVSAQREASPSPSSTRQCGRRELRYFAIAGLFTALTATDELPALSLFALLSAALLWKALRQTLIAYVPAALLVAAAFFGTNYIAHDSLRPPYMHRSETNPADNWYVFQYARKPGGPVIDSYWKNPVGIDKGQPSMGVYAFHALIGHHGIFSLTPIWLLALPGIWLLGRRYGLRDLALLIGSVTVVCVTFYICFVKPLDRNYGGMTSGFRWVFWFAPLWLLAVLPAADWLAATRWRRAIGYILLTLSVISASYPTWNPWTYPWLTNFFLYMGWAKF